MTNTTLYLVAFFHGGDYEMERDIIGIYSDEALAEKLAAEKKAMADGVIAKDKALQEQIAAL